MAAKFVVAVALFALCGANPVIINGVLYRDARSYSMGQASSYGNGVNQASANVNDGGVLAYGNTYNTHQLIRNDGLYPGQALAQAQAYDGAAKASAQTQNTPYYPVPAPATIVTYEQNLVPEVSYEIPAPGGLAAQSSAQTNGLTESSISSATSNGAGVAQSSAQTNGGIGSYGLTASNAQTYGSGLGSAASTANSGLGSAVSAAKTQGFGSASSTAQSNTPSFETPVVVQVIPEIAVIDAKTQGASYGVGSAVSNANVNGYGNAAASANTGNQRGIHWRFGTAYTAPAANSAQAQANTNGYGAGAAKSSANTYGYGQANSNANLNGGVAKTSANTNGFGSANANADINNAGYVKSAANTNGYGSAASQGSLYGYGGNTVTNARSNGFGTASSSAGTRDVSTAFRVANAATNTAGFGSAQANAISV